MVVIQLAQSNVLCLVSVVHDGENDGRGAPGLIYLHELLLLTDHCDGRFERLTDIPAQCPTF